MVRILGIVTLLVGALTLSGCGLPLDLGGYGGYGSGYGYGGYGSGYGYGGYGSGYGCAPGMAMPLPIPMQVDPGYGGGYVGGYQQPGQTYYQEPYSYGTDPGQYASRHRHRRHNPDQPGMDPNDPVYPSRPPGIDPNNPVNPTGEPRTGSHQPSNNWSFRRQGQSPIQSGGQTPTGGAPGTTGTTGTTVPGQLPGTTTGTTGTAVSSQTPGQVANSTQSSRQSAYQRQNPNQPGNFGQRNPGMNARMPQGVQGSRMPFGQPSVGARGPMAPAPQGRIASPMMSAPRAMAAPAPRAATGARPAPSTSRRGPGQ